MIHPFFSVSHMKPVVSSPPTPNSPCPSLPGSLTMSQPMHLHACCMCSLGKGDRKTWWTGRVMVQRRGPVFLSCLWTMDKAGFTSIVSYFCQIAYKRFYGGLQVTFLCHSLNHKIENKTIQIYRLTLPRLLYII